MKSTGIVAPRFFSVQPHKRLHAAQTKQERSAFTLIEFLAVMGGLALLACVALPVLAGTKSDGQRIFCVNNLRQIGQAWAGYKNEHGERMPVQLSVPDGGLTQVEKREAWRHFSFLSNHLATPKPLSCPADLKSMMAVDWSNRANGLMQPGGLGDSAVSYFVGLHGFSEYPGDIVGGDFGIGGMVTGVCGFWGVSAPLLSANNPSVGWTNYSHWSTGNLLLNDGQVRQTTDSQLRVQLQSPHMAEANQTHLMVPQR